MKKTTAEAALTLVLMAAIPVFIKFTVADPFTIGIFRLSVAAILMFIFFHPYKHFGVLRKSMVLPLVFVGVLFAAHWLTYFLSIKMATASIGILGMSTYGIHLIFLGWIFRKEKPGFFDVVALAVATFGTYLIVPEFSFTNQVTLGILIGIISGFCFALLPILHQHHSEIPERLRIFSQFFFAWAVFMFFFPQTEWSRLGSSDWWTLLYLAVPGTFIAHSLWVRVTTKLSTLISALIFYLIVPMTMIISHFWLEEPMPVGKVAGAILIISGNATSLYGKMKKI